MFLIITIIIVYYKIERKKNHLSTKNRWNSVDERSNSFYVMEENNDSLDIIGKIENIAPGESLYSARFIGNRGFLVTFEVIDPLFTVDLSDDPTSENDLNIIINDTTVWEDGLARPYDGLYRYTWLHDGLWLDAYIDGYNQDETRKIIKSMIR